MPTYRANTADTATAAANTAVVITYAASKATGQLLKQVQVNYSGAPTGGLLTIEQGAGNVVRRVPVTGTSLTLDFGGDGLMTTSNVAVIITLSAGGAGVIGYLNVTRMAVAT